MTSMRSAPAPDMLVARKVAHEKAVWLLRSRFPAEFPPEEGSSP